MQKRCRIPYCNGKIVPRMKGVRGAHHNCCKQCLPHYQRTKNTNRDIHRIIAFGQYKELKDIRCQGCKDSLYDHWNRHCKAFYRKRRLTREEKQDIVYKLFQVDHINGKKDRDYNNPKNLQVLCSNCHDVKSIIYGDKNGYRYKKKEK
jgi:hypothetical protein